jgi:hypothetical protein
MSSGVQHYSIQPNFQTLDYLAAQQRTSNQCSRRSRHRHHHQVIIISDITVRENRAAKPKSSSAHPKQLLETLGTMRKTLCCGLAIREHPETASPGFHESEARESPDFPTHPSSAELFGSARYAAEC